MTESIHTFLRDVPADQRQSKIAALPAWRKKSYIDRAIPGDSLNGVDFVDAFAGSEANFEAKTSPVRFDKFEHFEGSSALREVPTHKVVYHPDSGAPLGVVGEGYGVVQHSTALAGLASLEEQGLAKVEKISVQDFGARVTATALLGFSKVEHHGAQDSLAHLLRVTNTHDGSGAVRCSLSTLRLVCLNGMTTLSRDNTWSVRHTRNAEGYVTQLNDNIGRFVAQAKEEADEYAWLTQQKLALGEFVELATDILLDVKGDPATERQEANRTKEIEELAELFQHGAGNFGETKADGYNAFTEWLTVRRDQYADAAEFARRFDQSEGGRANDIRGRARQRLLRERS